MRSEAAFNWCCLARIRCQTASKAFKHLTRENVMSNVELTKVTYRGVNCKDDFHKERLAAVCACQPSFFFFQNSKFKIVKFRRVYKRSRSGPLRDFAFLSLSAW